MIPDGRAVTFKNAGLHGLTAAIARRRCPDHNKATTVQKRDLRITPRQCAVRGHGKIRDNDRSISRENASPQIISRGVKLPHRDIAGPKRRDIGKCLKDRVGRRQRYLTSQRCSRRIKPLNRYVLSKSAAVIVCPGNHKTAVRHGRNSGLILGGPTRAVYCRLAAHGQAIRIELLHSDRVRGGIAPCDNKTTTRQANNIMFTLRASGRRLDLNFAAKTLAKPIEDLSDKPQSAAVLIS